MELLSQQPAGIILRSLGSGSSPPYGFVPFRRFSSLVSPAFSVLTRIPINTTAKYPAFFDPADSLLRSPPG